MSNETQALPEFDSLHAALKYNFEDIQQESDPFRRLAWLIEQQEVYLRQRGLESRIPQMLGLSDAAALLHDCESILRDYYEISCDSNFPHQLVRKGMESRFRNAFVDVLVETEGEDEYFGDKQVISKIEDWLGFRQSALIVQRPVRGLSIILDEICQARSKLDSTELTRWDVCGQVNAAFVNGETLLRGLFSFYGRVFYGSNYVESMLAQYEEARSTDRLSSDIRQQLAREAGWLKAWLNGKWNLDFGNYCHILHRLDCWIRQACSSLKGEEHERGLEFQRLFQRQWLFPPRMVAGGSIQVPVKRGNRIEIESVSIEDPDVAPFVETLLRLNVLRPLYVHEDDPNFVHPTNLENMRDGARKVLDTFIDLWKGAQGEIFPPVVVLRRLLQIEPNLVRLDYLPEGGPWMEHVRVIATDLPPDITQFLGQEVYLHLRDIQGGVASVVTLYPVEEQPNF